VASPDTSGRFVLTRRAFMKAALAAGGAAALPITAAGREILGDLGLASTSSAGPTPLPGGPYFLGDRYKTAAAICDRIIPADVLGPGAAAAGAVNYIDLFLSAFQTGTPSPLAAGLVSTTPIYLHGRFSGRWAFGDPDTGQPGPTPSPDDFETNGQIQFLGLTAAQSLAWYLRLYGTTPGTLPPWMASGATLPTWMTPRKWVSEAESTQGATGSPPTIPGAQNLRAGYQQGLAAFDDWSEQNFQTPFSGASQPEQDALLLLASNPLLGAASQNGLPGLPAPLPNPVPPPAAAALFGVMVLHTIQGTYCLPEYNGLSDKALGGQVTWASVGWDGDTVPLGNAIYFDGPASPGPGQGENAGFGGTPGNSDKVFVPRGTAVEYRPTSTPGENPVAATLGNFSALIDALEKAGAVVKTLAQS
jgi:hypothetical protein